MEEPAARLPARWAVSAPPPGDLTAVEVHRVDEATFVLRQSKRTSPEAPIMYLLLGADRALLLDTGDSADPAVFPLRATVDGLVDTWLASHPRDGYGLVVAHSHAHHDHVAADGHFADRPSTRVVGHTAAEVAELFGLGPAGDDVTGDTAGDTAADGARFELGDRELRVLATPGHHPSSVTVYDPATGFLLTGDTVYPGRLYVDDLPAFRASIERLVAFAAEHPVSAVLGAHIEMSSTPGVDYPVGAPMQPDEAPLALPAAILDEVLAAALELERSGERRIVRDRFVVVDESPAALSPRPTTPG
jgi:glyoxylase-like metal-dependent hydrolase (beta-lactamase superfamily II)